MDIAYILEQLKNEEQEEAVRRIGRATSCGVSNIRIFPPNRGDITIDDLIGDLGEKIVFLSRFKEV